MYTHVRIYMSANKSLNVRTNNVQMSRKGIIREFLTVKFHFSFNFIFSTSREREKEKKFIQGYTKNACLLTLNISFSHGVILCERVCV